MVGAVPVWADISEIARVRASLPAEIRLPPLVPGPEGGPSGTWLLCENLQITGSYKIRAAFAVCHRYLAAGSPGPGIAVSSSGNFAIAFAFAGRALGIPVSIVMMNKSSPFKAERAAAYGARIVRCGDHTEERLSTLRQLRDEEGWWMLDHLEDPGVVAGHATLGLDLCHFWKKLSPSAPSQVLVPVSTAGLASGVALAVKQFYPECRVVGVQSEGSDAAAQSFRSGKMVVRDRVETECDALTANRTGALTLSLALDWLDDIVTVSEEAILHAVVALLEDSHLLVEPGGAVGFAALVSGILTPSAGTVVVLSGGNLDLNRLDAWRKADSPAA